MKLDRSVLNIEYESDDAYAAITCVSICSLLENNADIDEINIYYVMDNVLPENKRKLHNLCEAYGNAALIEIDASDYVHTLRDEYGVNAYGNSYATYFKLLAAGRIQTNNDRLVHLCCDTIVEGSLKPLCDFDLGGKMIAGTYDCLLNFRKQLIGIPKTDEYFSVGLTIFNQAKWRDSKAEEAIFDHYRHVRNRYLVADQDTLNVLFRKEFARVDLRYNFNPCFASYGVKGALWLYSLKPPYFDAAQTVQDAVNNTVVYHLTGAQTGRPWEAGSEHPWNGMYEKYLKLTPFADMPKREVKRSLVFRIQNKLYKALPRVVYLPIHKIIYILYLIKENRKVMKGAART